MPWSGSGVFTRIYSWVADAAAGINITASRMDADTNDIVTSGLGNCITRDGQGSATANQPMNGFRHTGASPGVADADYATVGQIKGTTGPTLEVTATTVTATDINATNASITNLTVGTNLTAPAVSSSEYVATGGGPGVTAGWAMPPTGPTAFTGATAGLGYTGVTSGVLAAVFYATSDARLKLDVADIGSEDALAWLDKSRPVTYRKRPRYDSPDEDAIPEAGFVAQEQVRAGFGRYVHTLPCEGMPRLDEPDGFTSLSDMMLSLPVTYQVAYLTAALQATRRELDVLRRRVMALEIER